MGDLWVQTIYIIMVLSGVGILWFLLRLAIFWIEAQKYHFKVKERLLLLHYIFKKRLRLSGFFHSKKALLQVIAIVPTQKSASIENTGLLERLYIAYNHLENRIYASSFSKKQQVYKNSSCIPVGTVLTIEFGDGIRKNAKLLGKEEKSLQIRLLDDTDAFDDEIVIHFWSYDAGYRFTSKVLKKKGLHLDVSHSRHVQQYLRRSHPRIKVEEPAYFFLLGLQDRPNYDIDTHHTGFECVIRDISEGGAAIIAEGRGQVGLHIKLQFRLNGRDLVMCGVIKDVYYDPEYNQSRLHMQADKDMPFKMKEPILSYVYADQMDSLE